MGTIAIGQPGEGRRWRSSSTAWRACSAPRRGRPECPGPPPGCADGGARPAEEEGGPRHPLPDGASLAPHPGGRASRRPERDPDPGDPHPGLARPPRGTMPRSLLARARRVLEGLVGMVGKAAWRCGWATGRGRRAGPGQTEVRETLSTPGFLWRNPSGPLSPRAAAAAVGSGGLPGKPAWIAPGPSPTDGGLDLRGPRASPTIGFAPGEGAVMPHTQHRRSLDSGGGPAGPLGPLPPPGGTGCKQVRRRLTLRPQGVSSWGRPPPVHPSLDPLEKRSSCQGVPM